MSMLQTGLIHLRCCKAHSRHFLHNVHTARMASGPETTPVGELSTELPDEVKSVIASLQSRSLQEAVTEKCKDEWHQDTETRGKTNSWLRNWFTKRPADEKQENRESISEQMANVARGELLRLLPLHIQARIFSYISVKERWSVLETISGGQAAIHRTQVNFRRAVLESYKSVKSVNNSDFGCTKLKFLQAIGNQLEQLKSRFPKVSSWDTQFDGSEVQGYFVDLNHKVRINHVSGSQTFVEMDPTSLSRVIPVDVTTVMLVCSRSSIFVVNLIDFSVRKTDSQYAGGTDIAFAGSLYFVGGRNSGRYSRETHTWERIADPNNRRSGCSLVIWNDALYALGSTAERYDPAKNSWTVVLEGCVFPSSPSYATVVFEDDVYCCRGPGKIVKVDMLTGKNLEEVCEGLPGFSHVYGMTYHLYVKEGRLYFVVFGRGCVPKNRPVYSLEWQTFVLDQPESKWTRVYIGAVPCAEMGDAEKDGGHFNRPLFL